MKKYYLESRSRGISYMTYVKGRLTGLVTFCIETVLYNMYCRKGKRRKRSVRKTRKKT
jgi:hypothetical protein